MTLADSGEAEDILMRRRGYRRARRWAGVARSACRRPDGALHLALASFWREWPKRGALMCIIKIGRLAAL